MQLWFCWRAAYLLRCLWVALLRYWRLEPLYVFCLFYWKPQEEIRFGLASSAVHFLSWPSGITFQTFWQQGNPQCIFPGALWHFWVWFSIFSSSLSFGKKFHPRLLVSFNLHSFKWCLWKRNFQETCKTLNIALLTFARNTESGCQEYTELYSHFVNPFGITSQNRIFV